VLARGDQLFLLNRGQTRRPVPPEAHVLKADFHNSAEIDHALDGQTFDVVVQWIGFTPEAIESDLARFRGRVGQYVFISSASAYQTPPLSLPVTESTPLYNPYWEYSRRKIACEQLLENAYREEGFPITIVRPSHTYDQTLLPFHGGYTMVKRMRSGLPVIVHGDGTSLWVLTHHEDFARGFVGLLGNPQAIGEAVQITSDELLTWNQIYQQVATAAGVEYPNLVHIPSDFIARLDPEWGASLLGDKTHSMIFDNQKIKRLVPGFTCTIPFWRGAREIIAWYDQDPARQVIDTGFDQILTKILDAYGQAGAAT
jgi:nucleoside-diphosphate-sugar epimerase